MTVADVFADARIMLDDVLVPHKINVQELYLHLNEGVREIIKRRPDMLFLDHITTHSPDDFSATTQTIEMVDLARRPLVCFIVAQCAFARDQVAKYERHMQKFEEALT